MINVPIAQSIRFRPINTLRSNFDNTFASDIEGTPYDFTLYVPVGDFKFQVAYDSGSIAAFLNNETLITEKSTSTINGINYDTYTWDNTPWINQCNVQIYIYQDAVLMYKSERFTVLNQPDYLLIEWFNSENNFQMDYSSGLTHSLQIDAKNWKLSYGGEASIYSNQGEDVKLKETVQRVFLLECELPDYMIEILRLATAHDRFYINEVEFVRKDEPVITQLGTSGMYTFSAKITQRTIVGLNTHDVG